MNIPWDRYRAQVDGIRLDDDAAARILKRATAEKSARPYPLYRRMALVCAAMAAVIVGVLLTVRQPDRLASRYPESTSAPSAGITHTATAAEPTKSTSSSSKPLDIMVDLTTTTTSSPASDTTTAAITTATPTKPTTSASKTKTTTKQDTHTQKGPVDTTKSPTLPGELTTMPAEIMTKPWARPTEKPAITADTTKNQSIQSKPPTPMYPTNTCVFTDLEEYAIALLNANTPAALKELLRSAKPNNSSFSFHEYNFPMLLQDHVVALPILPPDCAVSSVALSELGKSTFFFEFPNGATAQLLVSHREKYDTAADDVLIGADGRTIYRYDSSGGRENTYEWKTADGYFCLLTVHYLDREAADAFVQALMMKEISLL